MTTLRARFVLGGILFSTLALLTAAWLRDYLVVRETHSMYNALLLLGVFVVILLVPLSVAAERWVFRPLARLHRANLAATEHGLSGAVIPAAEIPPDEIGSAMRSRNIMLVALQEQRERLDTEKRHAEVLNQALLHFARGTVDAGLALIVDHVCAFLGLTGGWVALCPSEGRAFRVAAARGAPTGMPGWNDLAIGACPCLNVLAEGAAALETGVRGCAYLGGNGPKPPVLCVPLIADQTTMGMMVFLVPSGFTVPPPARAFLENIAGAVGLALSRDRLLTELWEMNVVLEDRVRRRTFELEMLHDLSQQVGYSLNHADLVRLLLEHLHRAVPYDVAASAVLSGPQCQVFLRPALPLSAPVAAEVEDRTLKALGLLVGNVQPAVPDRVQTWRLGPAAVAETAATVTSLQSVVQVPLLVGPDRQPAGLLLVGAEQPNAFNEDQVRLLNTVAHQGARSLERLHTLLAAEQERLAQVVERLPAGVLLLNAQQRVVLANPAARQYLPLLTAAAVGDVLHRLGDQDLAPRFAQHPFGTSWEVTPAGDAYRVFEVKSRPIGAGPEAGGWVLVIRDATWERELLANEQNRRRELGELYDLARHLVATDGLPGILDTIVAGTVAIVRVTFCRVLLEQEGDFVCAAVHPVRVLSRDLGAGQVEPAAAAPLYRRVLAGDRPLVVQPGDPLLTGAVGAALTRGVAQSVCLVPMWVGDEPIGLLVLGEARGVSREPLADTKLTLVAAIANQAASALYRARLHADLEAAYMETVLALARAMDARDTYTSDHSQRLADWAEATAEQLGCSREEIETIRWAALLHDIGKIGVPDAVLRKPGPLSAAEWSQMRRHPDIGADIVAPVKKLAAVAPLIRAHHERYDGSGYPAGLQGDEIPLGARILAVVDAYSAMTDDRVYRKGRTHANAVAELRRNAGIQFDPQVVAAFLPVLAREQAEPARRQNEPARRQDESAPQ